MEKQKTMQGMLYHAPERRGSCEKWTRVLVKTEESKGLNRPKTDKNVDGNDRRDKERGEVTEQETDQYLLLLYYNTTSFLSWVFFFLPPVCLLHFITFCFVFYL